MKLRRTTTDKPDRTEIRQPTCYEARDPSRPWLAAQDAELDDYDDIQLARFMAEHGAGATYTLGESYIPERIEPAPVRVKFAPLPIVSTRTPMCEPAPQIQEPAPETPRPIVSRPDPVIHCDRPRVTHLDNRMRVAIEHEWAGCACIRLLPDDRGTTATTVRAPEGAVRLQVDVPRWVEQATLTAMRETGGYLLIAE